MKTWIEFFQNRFYSLNGLPFFFFDNAMQLIWFTNNVSRFSGIFFIDFQWREIAVISPSKFSIVTFQRKLGPSYKWVPSFKKKNCLLRGKTNIPKHTTVLSLHTGHVCTVNKIGFKNSNFLYLLPKYKIDCSSWFWSKKNQKLFYASVNQN